MVEYKTETYNRITRYFVL